MQVGNLFNVAIVMAAIYVALSCVCSFINEQIAAFLRLRGEKLYTGILNMVFGNKTLVDAIVNHPLIDSASNNQRGIYNSLKPSNRPSYIEARNFSLAFWSAIAGDPGSAGPSIPELQRVVDNARQALDASDAANPERTTLQARADQAQAVLDAAKRAKQSSVAIADAEDAAEAARSTATAATEAAKAAATPENLSAAQAATKAAVEAQEALAFLRQLSTAPTELVSDLQVAAQHIPDPKLRTSLASLFATAGNDYDALLKATDDWFNAQMQRVSGWYSRQSQYILIAIALLVVAIPGIDSIDLAQGLYVSPALASIADAVVSAYPSPAPASGIGVFRSSDRGSRETERHCSGSLEQSRYYEIVSSRHRHLVTGEDVGGLGG